MSNNLTDPSLIHLIPEEQRLKVAKNLIASISDPEDRAIAEAALFLGNGIKKQKKKHVVVLVHGIRTHAVWQERLAAILKTKSDVEVFPIGYGFFDVLRFWCPLLTRKYPIARVLRELRTVRTKFPDADISIVAHSFGTYIITEILSEETDIFLHRVQLCGSIIDVKYRWDKVASRISGLIVNDAGTEDLWPILASMVSWGYGPSGTFGFKTVNVRDRYYKCGHSDFFSDPHMKKYWVPLIIDGQIKESNWSTSRTSPGPVISLLGIIPLKSLFIVLLGINIWIRYLN